MKLTFLVPTFIFLLSCFSYSVEAQEKTATLPQALTLAAPIGDHMVLQQGKASSVWGQSKPNSSVTVKIADQSHEAKADAAGNWTITLKPLKTNKTAQSLTITTKGGEKITVKDILVGEVWMCSGQSNMYWSLAQSAKGKEAIKESDHPSIRLFRTKTQTAAKPQTNVSGNWLVCSPKTSPNFSGVGYFFGKELLENLDVPIGLIATPWGGKPSEAFTSREKLLATPSAKDLLAEWDAKQAAYDPAKAKIAYDAAIEKWTEKVKALKKKAKETNTKTRFPRKPAVPTEPLLLSNAPSAIYNQMIAPWTRYGIAGAIWYQGESNRLRAAQYGEIFPAMIEDWHDKWNDKFPFYFVQLANFTTPSTNPGEADSWAELQDAQTLTLKKVPHTGMAIINDIGVGNDIHPTNKTDVGKRLSLLALHEHYGKKINPYCGPIFSKHEIDANGVTIHFNHVGKGLKTRDGKKLQRFEIAGKDKKFVWADAEISDDGKTIRVSSKQVPKPTAVRYAWDANPEGANLVNSAELPASLFRTDNWPLSTEGVFTIQDSVKNQHLQRLLTKNEELKREGWKILFNGKNTDGWRNPFKHGAAKVVDGEIHLLADKKFFLVTEKTYKDFILVADIHLPKGKANSGVMFRAHVEPGKVYGYQAECDGSERRWSGGLYDEGRRQWIWPVAKGRTLPEFMAHEKESLAHFAKKEVRYALKRNGWNRYEIRCKGDQIQIRINGVITTNIKDDMDAEGYIGIQHHGEKGQTYRFRNIYLKEIK